MCIRDRSRRKQGNETVIYLKQKAEQDRKVRQEELQLKRDAQVAQENHQKDMMQHLIKQPNQQKIEPISIHWFC